MEQKALETARAAVEALLVESTETARERELNTFNSLAGPLAGSIVLFGAGGLGRRCLAGLRRHGIEPVAFADNSERLWGKEVEGLTVWEPSRAAEKFGQNAVFVVTIWGGLAVDRMADHIAQLRSLGCRTVIPFGPLFWKYPAGVLPHYAADLPHHVLENGDEIMRCFDLWADDESRREYIAQLKWRLFFDFDDMAPPQREAAYFPPDLIALQPDEVFVDCGAYDGDTIRLFLQKSHSEFARAFALEPDPTNFVRLTECVANLPESVRSKIDTKCAAVGAVAGTVRFMAEGKASSAVGKGDVEVESVTLDQFLSDCRPTFIKMDIEGAEPDALRGAAKLIAERSPILAICCYHLQDHLWSIALLIRELNPNYQFYLRPHDLEGWDLVCYAIPDGRLPVRK